MASVVDGDGDGFDDLFVENAGEHEELPSDNENNENDVPAASVGQKLEPKKRVRNPRPRLTVDLLRGPRGLHTVENYFKDMKFKGKGYEKADLEEILGRLQHWGHRLYPNYTFDDILNNLERLAKNRPLQTHMSNYRLGRLDTQLNDAFVSDNPNQQEDVIVEDEPFDEFDALLGEQIAMSRIAPRTPSANTTAMSRSTLATPSFSRNAIVSTPYSTVNNSELADSVNRHASEDNDFSEYAQPLPPSQPLPNKLSAEQMERIAENRRLAQERLRAKQSQQN